jgi:hypothetical protein
MLASFESMRKGPAEISLVVLTVSINAGCYFQKILRVHGAIMFISSSARTQNEKSSDRGGGGAGWGGGGGGGPLPRGFFRVLDLHGRWNPKETWRDACFWATITKGGELV